MVCGHDSTMKMKHMAQYDKVAVTVIVESAEMFYLNSKILDRFQSKLLSSIVQRFDVSHSFE